MTTIANFVRDGDGNITIAQGTTVGWAYTFKDSSGSPLDVTGWTAKMQVRASYDAGVALLVLTTENGNITNLGSAGQLSNALLPADSSAVRIHGDSLECVYDYEVTKADGTVFRVDAGTFTILREVTRN